MQTLNWNGTFTEQCSIVTHVFSKFVCIMVNVTRELMILPFLVSLTHTKWQHAVCEEKHNLGWCLDTYQCIREFLNCNCVPLAAMIGSNTFPDTLTLCMMAYAWKVSEPICCTPDRKRSSTTSIPDGDISTEDSVISLIVDPVQKRDFKTMVEEIINNDRKFKTVDKRVSGHGHPSLNSGRDGAPDPYLISVPKPLYMDADTNLDYLWKKLENSDYVLHNSEDTPESARARSTNQHSKHTSSVKRTNKLSRQRTRTKDVHNSYRISIQKSSVNGRNDIYQSSRTSVLVNDSNGGQLDSAENLSATERENVNEFQSKLIHLLKCLVERE